MLWKVDFYFEQDVKEMLLRNIPDNDIQSPGNGSSGQFCLCLLNANLLEVDESRLVHVQCKSRPILTLRITAANWLKWGMLNDECRWMDEGPECI